jgi:hypothetical protein
VNEIPDDVLDAPVTGMNLVPGRLRDQLADVPTLFVFLRHFGCLFCRETVADLRAIAERDAAFPPLLFFTQSGSTELRAFLRRDWPSARAVADPDRHFYAAFGVERMSPLGMLRPALWAAERRARAKGHESGERTGDIWRLPGVFLVGGARVLWRYEFRHAGDHPAWDRIPAIAAASRSA